MVQLLEEVVSILREEMDGQELAEHLFLQEE
jgi:hypothetical protein